MTRLQAVKGAQMLMSSAIVFDGNFALAWLRSDSQVRSAGDGTGAAIVVAGDGTETRIAIGDEVEVPL